MGPAPKTAIVSPRRTFANSERVQYDGERLEQGCCIRVKAFRHWQNIVRRKVHELSKESGIRRRAQKPNVLAGVVIPAVALLAVVAVESRFKKCACACRNSRNAGPCADDLARGFVSEDNRVPDDDIANRTFGVVMQVGPAYPNALDSYLDLTGAWRHRLGFKHPKAPGFVKFGNEHDRLFLKQAVESCTRIVGGATTSWCDGVRRPGADDG